MQICTGEALFYCSQMELVSIIIFDKNKIAVLGKNPDSVQNNFLNTLYLYERQCRKKANKKSQEIEVSQRKNQSDSARKFPKKYVSVGLSRGQSRKR